MSYLLILMLAIRALICEKVWPVAGIFWDICFCVFFVLYIMLDNRLILNKKHIIYPLVFSGLLLFNMGFSLNLYNSQNEAVKFCIYLLIFSFVFWQNKKKRAMIIVSIFTVGLVISLRAVYQYVYGLEYIKQHYAYEQIVAQGFYAIELLKQKRVISWFLSPNLLAGYLLMIAPLAGVYAFNSYKQNLVKQTVFFSLVFIFAIIGLGFTGSWAAYLGLSAASLVIIFRCLKNKKLIICGVFLLLVFAALLSQRMKYFVDLTNPENSLVQRFYYWQTAGEIIKENPLFGIGLGNFGLIYPQFKQIKANETIYAHNVFLQLWTELGTIIFFCFFSVFAYMFIRAFKQARDPLTISLLAASFGFLIQNFFDYSLLVTQSGYVFFIILALIFKPKDDVDLEKNNQFSWNIFLNKISYILLSILMIFFLTREYNSQVSLDKASLFLKQGKVAAAIAQAERALKYRSNNDEIYYLLAVCSRQKNMKRFSPETVKFYQKAIDLNPDYAFYYYYLADYYLAYKFYPLAQAAAQLAVKYYPQNKKFREMHTHISDLAG